MTDAVARDPVCGMRVHADVAVVARAGDRVVLTCSDLCRRMLEADPARYPSVEQPAPAPRVAWFSMEIALGDGMPTYAGGLGVVAGDLMRSCADLGMPIIAVSLVYRRGHFRQDIGSTGEQRESDQPWDPAGAGLQRLGPVVEVIIEGRRVTVAGWRARVSGAWGSACDVVLLDTDVDANAPEDRRLTDVLYGGDARTRLAQEIVLGVAGVRMLRALGHATIERYHLNEGHAALLSVELLRERSDGRAWDFDGVRNRCVFTTHTPVPAGHDQFEWPLVERVVGDALPMAVLRMLSPGDRMNMTRLALSLSHYVNGVARRHGDVSQQMFPDWTINAIDNGVHPGTWVAPAFGALYDRAAPAWRRDPSQLRHAMTLRADDLRAAHAGAARVLRDEVLRRTGRLPRDDAFTIGFARRFTEYKRPGLLFTDLDALRRLAASVGRLQIVMAGKAHPHDDGGLALIREIHGFVQTLGDAVPVHFVPDYDLPLARALVAGVDLWLNTPRAPLEASGTSCMKAALNGVPQLSVLDGWWVDGHVEGVTGWSIEPGTDDADEAANLYRKLETIARLFFRDPEGWAGVMRGAIAINGSYFNTHRMAQQYAASAWL